MGNCIVTMLALVLLIGMIGFMVAMIPIGFAVLLVLFVATLILAAIGWIIIGIEKIQCKFGHHSMIQTRFIDGVKYGYCANCKKHYRYDNYTKKWVYIPDEDYRMLQYKNIVQVGIKNDYY